MQHDERAETVAKTGSAIDPQRYRPRPTLTAREVADRAGVDLATAKRVNRALGLPELDEASVEFSERDVEVLSALRALIDGGIPLDDLITVARVYGQSLARLADAETRVFQAHVVEPLLERGRSSAEIDERLVPLVSRYLELVRGVLDYLHRRHVSVAMHHLTAAGSEPAGEVLAVGFVDLVDFSALADELHGSDLGRVVDRFEEIVVEACSDPLVRVVKMIGDAAMVVSAEPHLLLDAARGVVRRVAADDRLPAARAGVDHGEVLPFAGDYFGPGVNVAARIVAFARPGTTVVSERLLRAVHQGSLDVSRIGVHKLKGVGRVRLFKVRDHQLAA